MARKKLKDSGASGSWLNTYADMVTLLLTFFIMLFAMSSLDKEKFLMLVQAFSDGNNVIVAPEDLPSGDKLIDDGSISDTPVVEDENLEGLDILYQMIMKYIKEHDLEGNVAVQKSEDAVFIRFGNDVFFDGYSSVIKKDGRDILDVVAVGLKEVDYAVNEIVITGHTATVEGDNTKIDRKLSSERAATVLTYIENKNMFDPAKLISMGFGLYRPIASNDTPEGRAKNRRVEILIMKKGHTKSFSEYMYDVLDKRQQNEDELN